MMLTRCPGCSTTFRVTPEQVKARQGKVRCGRCQNIFNAIESLVEAAVVPAPDQPAVAPELPTASTAPTSATPAPPTDAASVEQAPTASAETTQADSDIAVEAPDTDAAAEDEGPVPAEEIADTGLVDTPAEEAAGPIEPTEAAPEAEDNTDIESHPTAPRDDDILLQPSPLSSTYTAQAKAAQQPSWPWTLGATLVFLALLAQCLLAFRVDLAVKYPQSRPLLGMLCEYADCTVELPTDPDMVSIEGSDLHPGKPGELELNATLRNRAPHALAWPHLELTLTDGADKPIVRKVIAPEQYLPALHIAADGFAANSDQTIQLQLDAGSLPAAGYRLYLFYP